MAEVWDDARIREAFIDDGGLSEYHDPINGAREQRRIAGSIFDAWLAERDQEREKAKPMVVRSREALARAMASHRGEGWAWTDTDDSYAQGTRRNWLAFVGWLISQGVLAEPEPNVVRPEGSES